MEDGPVPSGQNPHGNRLNFVIIQLVNLQWNMPHTFHFKHLRCSLEVCPELMSRNQRTTQRGWLILMPHEDKVDMISPINIFSSLKPRLVLWFRTCISRPLQANLSHGSGVNLGCQNQQKTKTFGSSTKNPLRPRTWSTRTPTSLCFSGHLNLDHLDPQPHFLICCPHWKTSELEFPWPQRWLPIWVPQILGGIRAPRARDPPGQWDPCDAPWPQRPQTRRRPRRPVPRGWCREVSGVQKDPGWSGAQRNI